MILIQKKNGTVYFRLLFLYWYSWYSFDIIDHSFDSVEYTKSDVRKIKIRIKAEADKRFK